MKILILTVGRPRDKAVAAMADDYIGRIKPSGLVSVQSVNDSRSKSDAVEREGQEMLKQLRPRDRVVLLRDDGREFTSPEFASFVSKEMESSAGRLVFIIGGPWGTSDALKQRADVGLSLSRMTFTHEMCFLFLTEQLYRAFSILQGTGYHH